jgi:hypothetical protein
MQMVDFIQQNAENVQTYPRLTPQPVNPAEDLYVFAIQGWKGPTEQPRASPGNTKHGN